jgi:surfeit locus 1 family protein
MRRRTAVALAAAVAGIAVAISLGNWQSRRAEQKLALQAQWDTVDRAAPEMLTVQNLAAVSARLPLRVALRGRFVHDRSVWLDNRQQ